eukprot:2531413-Pyramimonas_sp.AAC.1
MPEEQLVSMFDHLVQRLSDGNSKVNIQALAVLENIFPALGETTACVLNTLVPAMVTNLGSTNEKIRWQANKAVDALTQSMDSAALLQNFAHCASHGGARTKHVMLDKLAAITPEVYRMRPRLVTKYLVPTSFAMLVETRGEVKAANARLLKALWEAMGSSLKDHGTNLSPLMQSKLDEALKAQSLC